MLNIKCILTSNFWYEGDHGQLEVKHNEQHLRTNLGFHLPILFQLLKGEVTEVHKHDMFVIVLYCFDTVDNIKGVQGHKFMHYALF